MTKLWSDQTKYQCWLNVELAVLWAKAELGMIPESVQDQISRQAKFTVERIEELDATLRHDLIAFVQTVQESLDPDLRPYFHADITSYDTEEPAMAVMIVASLIHIRRAVSDLLASLASKALKYKHLIKIQRTHGQHAQPATLGLEFLWWYDSVKRQVEYLNRAEDEMVFTKVSGAVGTYEGRLSPELESLALAYLNLKPASISMQIILRDRHAHMISALAVLAAVLENIALNVELMGQTEICELQEPFGASQKGSSLMPHKKNTILSENLRGLARLVRSYVDPALENVATWGGRDISHSSVERVIFPDAFNVIHFMLGRVKKLIDGLVVNEYQIERNLNFSKGAIFSPDVKELLMANGYDPEAAYRIAQEAAFDAMKHDTTYYASLCARSDISAELKDGSLKDLFDLKRKVRYVDEVFARFSEDNAFKEASSKLNRT